jgi:ArsR family transcriptional regulator
LISVISTIVETCLKFSNSSNINSTFLKIWKYFETRTINTITAAAQLESLGNPTRLALLRRLVRAGTRGQAVGELQTALDVPGSTLSHHIQHLVHRGLVTQVREGRVLRCSVNFNAMNDLVGYLMEECCRDEHSCDEECRDAQAREEPREQRANEEGDAGAR